MKVALTTSGETLSAPLDPVFGRAARFVVYDTDVDAYELVDNDAVEAAHGAGLQAAETLVRLGVRGLVTGRCGPNAMRVLERAGIEVYTSEAHTLHEAIDAYKAGRLVAQVRA
jgi:predicted Fe-Mo cluster-binding NifX family protein